MTACKDPGIFVRGGGGGGPGLSDKKSSDNVFFLVLSLLWSCNFKEIYHFSRFQRGSNNFQGGGSNFFQGGGGGSNGLFHIEKHMTCDFRGGVGTPCPPPLDPHLDCISSRNIRVKCLLTFY